MKETAESKRYSHGTHRILVPSETLMKIKPKLTDIGVTRVANITGLDYINIPVAMSVRPGALGLSVQQGKGLTPEAAKVSAIMESVESYSAQRIPANSMRRAANSLDGATFVIPKHLVRGRIRRMTPISWMQGYDIIQSKPVLIPEELIRADFSWPPKQGYGRFLASSNGLAAGNSFAEAQLHAMCEVIERDALTLWHYQPRSLRSSTRVDPDSLDDPAVNDLLARYRAAKIQVDLWEITSDLGIPCFYCVIDDRDARPPFLGKFGGSGCHLSAGVAACRALTEAAQSRLTFIAGSREDLPLERYLLVDWHENLTNWLNTDPLHQNSMMRPVRTRSLDQSSIQDDINSLIVRLKSVGADQVIVVDLSDESIDVPCLRVVIPELEGTHRNPDYKPGSRAQRLRRQ